MGGKKKSKLTLKLESLIKQISGKFDKDNPAELFPEYQIKGKGAIYCLSADNRSFVKISRGIAVYVVQEEYDTQGRTLIYTYYGDIVVIDPKELIEIGFD